MVRNAGGKEVQVGKERQPNSCIGILLVWLELDLLSFFLFFSYLLGNVDALWLIFILGPSRSDL